MLNSNSRDPGYGILYISLTDVNMGLPEVSKKIDSGRKFSGLGAHGSQSLWALLQICDSQGTASPIWFTDEEENVHTAVTKLSEQYDMIDANYTEKHLSSFDYCQSSKPISLDRASLERLLESKIKCDIFAGDSRSKDIDEFLGSDAISIQDVLLRKSALVRAVSEYKHIYQYARHDLKVSCKIQCSASLLDALTGVRRLSIDCIEIVNLPAQWMPLTNEISSNLDQSKRDETRVQFDLAMNLPGYSAQKGGVESIDPALTRKHIINGMLLERSNAEQSTLQSEDANESFHISFQGPISYVLFPEVAAQLMDCIKTYKYATATVHRYNYDLCSILADVEVCKFNLSLADLLIAGNLITCSNNVIRCVDPKPPEYYAIAAASAEDKKELQTAFGDYEVLVANAKRLHASMASAGTQLAATFAISPYSLIRDHKQEILQSDELENPLLFPNFSPREYTSTELEQSLENEIRRVLVLLLRELHVSKTIYDTFENKFYSGNLLAVNAQELVLNELITEEKYHELREIIKARLMRVTADAVCQFRPSLYESIDANSKQARANTSGSMHLFCMSKIKKVMTSIIQQRNVIDHFEPEKPSQSSIEYSGLKALDTEVTLQHERSEAIHLDRIAHLQVKFAQLLSCTNEDKVLKDHASIWYDYACFCIRQQAIDKARVNLQRSLSLCSDFGPALITLAALHFEINDLNNADLPCKSAITVSENARDYSTLAIAHGLLAYFYKSCSSDTKSNLLLYEIECAKNVISKHLQETASTASVWLMVAYMAYNLHLHKLMSMCLDLVNSGLDLSSRLRDDERILRHLLKSEVYTAMNDRTNAVVFLEKALGINDSNSLVWYAYGNIYMRNDEYPDAIRCYELALPNLDVLDKRYRAATYINLGNLLLQSSRFEAARNVWIRACRDFKLASFLLGLGVSLYRLGQWRNSEAYLAEATKLDHGNAEAWGYLALLYYDKAINSNDDGEATVIGRIATRLVEVSLQCNLSNASLLRELGNACVALDHLNAAKRLLRRSLYIRESHITRKALGDVLLAQNLAEEALEQYSQIIGDADALELRSVLLDNYIRLLKTLGRNEDAGEFEKIKNQIAQTRSELHANSDEHSANV